MTTTPFDSASAMALVATADEELGVSAVLPRMLNKGNGMGEGRWCARVGTLGPCSHASCTTLAGRAPWYLEAVGTSAPCQAQHA